MCGALVLVQLLAEGCELADERVGGGEGRRAHSRAGPVVRLRSLPYDIRVVDKQLAEAWIRGRAARPKDNEDMDEDVITGAGESGKRGGFNLRAIPVSSWLQVMHIRSLF